MTRLMRMFRESLPVAIRTLSNRLPRCRDFQHNYCISSCKCFKASQVHQYMIVNHLPLTIFGQLHTLVERSYITRGQKDLSTDTIV